MAWDSSMITDFTDSQIVDEGDMDPIVKNLASLQFAEVFLGGVQRVTQVTGINSTTERLVLQLPAVTVEAGYLYRIHGLMRVINTVTANSAPTIIGHEGTTIAGATVMSFTTPLIDTTTSTTAHGFAFSVCVKPLATVSQAYNISINRHRGSGTLIVDVGSWAGISRSGNAALMTDV